MKLILYIFNFLREKDAQPVEESKIIMLKALLGAIVHWSPSSITIQITESLFQKNSRKLSSMPLPTIRSSCLNWMETLTAWVLPKKKCQLKSNKRAKKLQGLKRRVLIELSELRQGRQELKRQSLMRHYQTCRSNLLV